jgi:hypothetical protein
VVPSSAMDSDTRADLQLLGNATHLPCATGDAAGTTKCEACVGGCGNTTRCERTHYIVGGSFGSAVAPTPTPLCSACVRARAREWA